MKDLKITVCLCILITACLMKRAGLKPKGYLRRYVYATQIKGPLNTKFDCNTLECIALIKYLSEQQR